jgi:hypothetical protein
MKKSHSILKQIKQNSVAIISLIIALTSLSYNTWRNEQSEQNRNERYAAFQILMTLNELQQLVFHRRYDPELLSKGNPRTGWKYILTIKDYSYLLSTPFIKNADKLQTVWQNNWVHISAEKSHADYILNEIDSMRDETIKRLQSLN